MRRLIGFVAALCALSAFAQSRSDDAANAIQPSWIAPHVRFLADSVLEGRDTGSFGYNVASRYVATQFQLLGLQPAGDAGSYFQTVRIRKTTIAPDSAALSVGSRSLQFGREFFVHAGGDDDGLVVTAPLVFAGFGVTAPEYHYDDYAEIDAHGKIVVLMPGVPASFPRDVRALYSVMNARFHNAREHGALAVMVLNPDMPADTVQERQIRQLDATTWRDASGHAHSIDFAVTYVIIPKEGIGALFADQTVTIADLRKRIAAGPAGFDMHVQATVRARFDHHDSETSNIVGLLKGTDRASEYVVYSAHLDHDGVSAYFPGDHVLHGALDNAGGIATILAVARAFGKAGRPSRSILFLAVTGEEKGLIGSDYFVHNPTVPRDAIVADINCDNFLWYVPLVDIGGIALQYSTLQDDFAAAAARMHLQVSPQAAGPPFVLVLSDHFSFLEAGIPAVSVINGQGSGDGKRTGDQIFADYMRDIHHTPKDSIDQAIDWNAAATEARFVFLLGEHVANNAKRPAFTPNALFHTAAAAASSGAGTAADRN